MSNMLTQATEQIVSFTELLQAASAPIPIIGGAIATLIDIWNSFHANKLTAGMIADAIEAKLGKNAAFSENEIARLMAKQQAEFEG